jgi:tetratricopeptide (TPR) repeat protein
MKEGLSVKKKMTLYDEYTTALQTAAAALSQGDMMGSLPHIRQAMALNMDAPEPHNLLGILSEMKGDDGNARRHYRAAYALDPTYSPACRNLERLVVFEWGPVGRQYDYGISVQPEAAGNAESSCIVSAIIAPEPCEKEKKECISL